MPKYRNEAGIVFEYAVTGLQAAKNADAGYIIAVNSKMTIIPTGQII